MNLEANSVLKFLDLAKLQQAGKKKMMCDSQWVFSNRILFGENNPSWSALFSRDAGNNSPPQREELGFSFSVSTMGATPGHA